MTGRILSHPGLGVLSWRQLDFFFVCRRRFAFHPGCSFGSKGVDKGYNAQTNLCAITWVAGITWAKVRTVATFSWEGFQDCIVCGRQLTSQASFSVKWWLFQLDIDGLLYSFLNHLSCLSSTCTFSSSKECPFSSKCKWTAESCLEELPLWCWAICLWRGCLFSLM